MTADPRFSTAKWKSLEKVPEFKELEQLEQFHDDEDEKAATTDQDGETTVSAPSGTPDDDSEEDRQEVGEDEDPAINDVGSEGEGDADANEEGDGNEEDAGDEDGNDVVESAEDGVDEALPATGDSSAPLKKSKLRQMTAKQYEEFKEQYNRRGVVYISRIPPFMRPQALKKLMSEYGEVLRLFMTPEDEASRKRRKKSGGNRGIKFSDGWVEFADKKVAKQVAATMNGQPIGGKKRSRWHDDIINVKYLSGFKWHHLTEKIAAARNERATRIRNEMTEAHRAATHYQKQAERSRTRKAIELKKKRKHGEDEADDGTADRGPAKLPKQRRLLDPELAEGQH